jgi:methyl-accepting chemotaxis protein
MKNIKLTHRIWLLAALAIAGVMLTSYLGHLQYAKDNRQAHYDLAKSQVETATSVVRAQYELFRSGELTEAQAKENSIATIEKLRYGNDDYFWINDMAPNMVMHPFKPELNGKSLQQVKDPEGTLLFVEMVRTVKKDGAGFVDYLWPLPGESEPVEKISYVQGFEPWGWVIGSGLYLDELASDIASHWQVELMTAVPIILVIGGIALFVGGSIQRRIKTLSASVKTRAADMNFYEPLDVSRKDELGDMAESFNRMIAAAAEAVRQTGGSVTSLRGKVVEIKNLTQTGVTNSEGQTRETQESAAAIEQMSSAIHEVASNAQDAASASEEASAKVEESRNIVRSTITEVVQLSEDIGQASSVIGDLKENAGRINHILDVIGDIAEQTNLLALNAAIEAARAGDQGRGFAVVADEVRSLAKRTQDSASEVHDLIQTLQKSSDASVSVMESSQVRASAGVDQIRKAGEALDYIEEAVTRIKGMNISIASAVEEQSAVSEEITASVSRVSDLASATRDTQLSIQGGVQEIDDLGGEVEASLSKIHVSQR